MSTKAIREALDWLENYLGNEPEAQEARRAARAEVEAIERAARIICDKGQITVPSDSTTDRLHVGEAELLLIEIADRHDP